MGILPYYNQPSPPTRERQSGKRRITVKQLMKKAHALGQDSWLSFLAMDWRNIRPSQGLELETSAAQRLLSRRTQTLLPIHEDLLKPRLVQEVAQHFKKLQKQKQAEYYDRDRLVPISPRGRSKNTAHGKRKHFLEKGSRGGKDSDTIIHSTHGRRKIIQKEPQSASEN